MPNPPRRVWRDWVLVAVLVPTAILEGILRPDLPWRPVSLIVGVALIPTLLWRRTHPLATVAVAFGTAAAMELIRVPLGVDPPGLYTQVFVILLAYALFRWGSGREAIIGFGIMLVPATGALVFDYTGLADAIGGFTFFFSMMAAGALVRYRRVATGREKEQVRFVEREQLARDVHDTVAHHVSAIVIRAQAGLATASSNPDAACDALGLIEAEAARTLNELRTMVRMLRRDDLADLAPLPLLTDLGALTQDFGTQGVGGWPSVEVDLRGDIATLPDSVSTALYRLVQESVTNARRHARNATRITIDVDAEDTSVRLCVHDDGDNGHSRHAPHAGYGIRGMIERAVLLGGTCTAGPNPDRGWTVAAQIPIDGRVP